MSNKQDTPLKPTTTQKPGLFARIINKLDAGMKEKAEAKAKDGSCCGKDSKGNKCC